MARRSTTRRVLKWAGTVACVLLVGAFVLSAWYQVQWHSPYATGGLYEGRVGVFLLRGPQPGGLRVHLLPPHGWRFWPTHISSSHERLRGLFWLPRVHQYTDDETGGVCTSATVPIWVPLLLVALPNALLWWRDRRRIPPGHCRKCGYNLTGNVSGICPECGTPIVQPSEGRR